MKVELEDVKGAILSSFPGHLDVRHLRDLLVNVEVTLRATAGIVPFCEEHGCILEVNHKGKCDLSSVELQTANTEE